MPNTEPEEMPPQAEVIRELRTEITNAASAGAKERIRFGVGPIDLKFRVVARREGGPSGKIKFGIWGIGVEAGRSKKSGKETTQKVKFALKPVRIEDDGSETDLEIFGERRKTTATNQTKPRARRPKSS
jgi:Trypsin-co-occurring domain 2